MSATRPKMYTCKEHRNYVSGCDDCYQANGPRTSDGKLARVQIEEAHKEYPVLSVCLEDFEDDLERRKDDGLADDEWVKEGEENLETAKSMTPEEWGYFAELVAENLWTESFSELWQDAKMYAIERIRKMRLGTDGPL